jgi:hypothetical protein
MSLSKAKRLVLAIKGKPATKKIDLNKRGFDDLHRAGIRRQRDDTRITSRRSASCLADLNLPTHDAKIEY